MANPNLGQDVANKREKIYTDAHKVAKSYVLQLAAAMRRCGSLININPFAENLLDRMNPCYMIDKTRIKHRYWRACNCESEEQFMSKKTWKGEIRGVDINERNVTTHSYSLAQGIRFGNYMSSYLFYLSSIGLK